MDVDMADTNKYWLQSGEQDSELMAWESLFFRIDRRDGRIERGTPILLAENYDTQEDH